MSVGEKMYLVMILTMFASFIVMIGTLSWLDAKDARIERLRNKARQETRKPGVFITGHAAARR